jgi:hypothetical protein
MDLLFFEDGLVDTSEKYIEMCASAKVIQHEWNFKVEITSLILLMEKPEVVWISTKRIHKYYLVAWTGSITGDIH